MNQLRNIDTQSYALDIQVRQLEKKKTELEDSIRRLNSQKAAQFIEYENECKRLAQSKQLFELEVGKLKDFLEQLKIQRQQLTEWLATAKNNQEIELKAKKEEAQQYVDSQMEGVNELQRIANAENVKAKQAQESAKELSDYYRQRKDDVKKQEEALQREKIAWATQQRERDTVVSRHQKQLDDIEQHISVMQEDARQIKASIDEQLQEFAQQQHTIETRVGELIAWENNLKERDRMQKEYAETLNARGKAQDARGQELQKKSHELYEREQAL